MAKKGLLLVNLGTPDAPTRSAVKHYLKEFLLDRRVIDIPTVPRNILVRGIIAPFRSGKSAALYRRLWTPEGSPIKTYGKKLCALVQEELGDEWVVGIGMRYQGPSIGFVLQQLLRENITELVVLPLFPQYASATTGSVFEEVMKRLAPEQVIPPVRFIQSYPDNKDMIEVFAENGRKHDISKYDHVIFSYHGLPQRQLVKADRNHHCLQSSDCCKTLTEKNQFCYSAQCHATTKALTAVLNLKPDQYTTCFQSRLGQAAWIQPYTSDVLKERRAKGDKRVLVFSPAFVADCLETTIEIGVEYTEEWEDMGGDHLQLVESLNDNPAWVKAVANMARS